MGCSLSRFFTNKGSGWDLVLQSHMRDTRLRNPWLYGRSRDDASYLTWAM